MVMSSDGEYLTGLFFSDHFYGEESFLPVFLETKRWLDIYFGGMDPGFLPKMKFEGLSDFRAEVTERLLRIPYGFCVSYGEIAEEIAAERGGKMSAQAVGGAVGSNPICIIVPCHRVLGAKGKLTGYGGGLENKRLLLRLEGIEFSE